MYVRRARRYWPPVERERSAIMPLPGDRKQCFVFNGKRDEDGKHVPMLVLTTRGGHKLFALEREEFNELKRIGPRLLEYMKLSSAKLAEREQERALRDVYEGDDDFISRN